MKNKDLTGGQLGEYPNDKYRLFFEKFAEINSLPIDQWKPVHLIAYFCKKYQEQYNIKYSFKFNNPAPTKCFEVFQIKRLGMLLSSKPLIIKEYIDWVYETKVILAKRRLTSISFLTTEGVVTEYKMNVLLAGHKNDNIDRTTPLPDKYKEIFNKAQMFVANYGDLAFISNMEKTPEIIEAFNKIEEIGFNKDVLSKIL